MVMICKFMPCLVCQNSDGCSGCRVRPRWLYASVVTSRPLGVRLTNPSFIRKGSYTSSSVPGSSPSAVAIVDRPTGPPENLSIIVSSILLSISSSPYLSMFSASSAMRAMPSSIVPPPLDHGEVSYAAQKRVGHTWRASAAQSYFGCCIVGAFCP